MRLPIAWDILVLEGLVQRVQEGGCQLVLVGECQQVRAVGFQLDPEVECLLVLAGVFKQARAVVVAAGLAQEPTVGIGQIRTVNKADGQQFERVSTELRNQVCCASVGPSTLKTAPCEPFCLLIKQIW